jgi:hypothetical protein
MNNPIVMAIAEEDEEDEKESNEEENNANEEIKVEEVKKVDPKYYDNEKYTTNAMNMANNYTNDNYYKAQNNDFIKKIKCNNINSNLTGVESTIGLDEVLGAGGGSQSIQQGDSGEVSANAYGNAENRNNNGNFDIDCINNNGNEGVQGATGPRGPQGPNQILPTNLYQVDGPAETGDLVNSNGECDPGDTVMSGGYVLRNPELADIDFLTLGAITEFTEWSTSVGTADNVDVTIQTFAYCFDNPPAHIP